MSEPTESLNRNCKSNNCSCKEKEKSVSVNDDNEEVWGEDPISNPHNDIIRHHYKQGYLNGLTSNKENSLQSGFNKAYPIGAEMGIQVGKILSKLKASRDQDSFDRAKKELNITNILSESYFDDELNLLNNTHALIDKY